jgi:hypothetical protein
MRKGWSLKGGQPSLAYPGALETSHSLRQSPRERGHGGLARRGIAVGRTAIFVVPKGYRPHPRRHSYGRCVDLEDAADNIAVGQHVEIIFVPVAGGPACRCALEDEGVLLHRQSVRVHH